MFFMVQTYTDYESESYLFYTSLKAFSVCLFFNIFTYLAALDLSCSLWDLVPQSGIESAPPQLPHCPPPPPGRAESQSLDYQECPESIQFCFFFFFFGGFFHTLK